MREIEWLPDLLIYKDTNEWSIYLNILYHHFTKDFVRSSPKFFGARFGLKRYPLSQGKEATFWHMISEGDTEEERNIDFRRCERIRWPRSIIDHAPHHDIKIWENKRGSKTRILLWLEEYDYLIVLDKRKDFILPWTAYYVEYKHSRRKYQKEYQKYIKKNGSNYELKMES